MAPISPAAVVDSQSPVAVLAPPPLSILGCRPISRAAAVSGLSLPGAAAGLSLFDLAFCATAKTCVSTQAGNLLLFCAAAERVTRQRPPHLLLRNRKRRACCYRARSAHNVSNARLAAVDGRRARLLRRRHSLSRPLLAHPALHSVARCTTTSRGRSSGPANDSHSTWHDLQLLSGRLRFKDSRRAPRLTQAAFAWFARRFPGATATSCTIAFNRQAPLHVDKNNIGASYLTCLGRFTGGALWVSGERRARTLALSRRQWHKFDSRWPHCGSHFRGERCYVSFYTHKAILRTAAAQKAVLRRLGVPLPTQAAARACFRAAFAADSRARWALANVQWASAGVALERPALEHWPSSWICWECGAFGSNTGFGRPRLHCCRNCKQQAYRRWCAER